MLITKVFVEEEAKFGDKTNFLKRPFLFTKIACHYKT